MPERIHSPQSQPPVLLDANTLRQTPAQKLVEVIEGHREFGNQSGYLNSLDYVHDLPLRREVLQFLAQYQGSNTQKIINKIKEIPDENTKIGALRYVAYKGHPSFVQAAVTGLAELSDVVASLYQLKELVSQGPKRVQKAAARALNKQAERYASLPLEQRQEAYRLVFEHASSSQAVKKTLDDVMALPQPAQLNLLVYAGEKGRSSLKCQLRNKIKDNPDYFRNMQSDPNSKAKVVRFGLDKSKELYNDTFYQMILEAPDPCTRLECLKHVAYHARNELAKDALHHISRVQDKVAAASALLEIAENAKPVSVAKEARNILMEHADTYRATGNLDLFIKLHDYAVSDRDSLSQRLRQYFRL